MFEHATKSAETISQNRTSKQRLSVAVVRPLVVADED